ncbi:MAG: hypothetical protein E6864_01310, partial [Peptoniphilus harei]|nr:hypothetical protein [Peptoniphilus harei]
MKNIIENLKDGYSEIKLNVNLEDLNGDSLKFSIRGEKFFISLFIYRDDKIVGSITANRDVERFMAVDILKSSNGFKNLESGDYRINYLLYKEGEVLLKIEDEKSLLEVKKEFEIEKDEIKCREEKWYAGDFH